VVMIFISGGTGKLGQELVKLFPSSLHPAHDELDITNAEALFQFIKKEMPDVIIHCAALANVTQCEENKELAWRINVQGTGNLIDACQKYKHDCYFVYMSTACVFYGDKGDYVETDIPHPKNFYSLTKLLGEVITEYSGLKKCLIIRTNFVSRRKWPYPKAFIDRYGTYLFADDLALAIRSILHRNLTGTIHVCGEEKMSMFEVATITTPNVKPMTLTDYKGPPLTVDMSLRSIRIDPFKITRAPAG
jgi:dTDP-4-dehydrorhamnose reductase